METLAAEHTDGYSVSTSETRDKNKCVSRACAANLPEYKRSVAIPLLFDL